MAANRKGDVELVVSAKNEATKTIEELVDAIQELGKEAGSSGIGGIFKKLTQDSESLTRKQEELTKALKESKQAQDQLQKANEAREKDLRSQRDSIDKTQKSLERLNAKYDEYAAEARKARTPSEALAKTLQKQRTRQEELAQSIQETSAELRRSQQSARDSGGVDEKAEQNIERQRKKVIELGQAWRDITRQVAQAQSVLAERTTRRDTADAGQKEAQARLDALREELKVARQLESEKRKAARSEDADEKEVRAKEEAIATTKRLREAIAEQVLVEREARAERDAAAKSYRQQSKEVDKLVSQADKQKAAYAELKASLVDYEAEQKQLSTERQRANIEKLNTTLQKLQEQYEGAASRVEATQQRFDKAAGPDPQAVKKFENLQAKIRETEQEISDQTVVLERLEREYREAGASADQLAQKERELERVTQQLTEEQRDLQQATEATAKSTDKAGREAAQAGRRFKVWGDDSRQALSFLQRIRGELLSIAAAYTGVFAVGGAVRSIYDASVLTQRATARLAAKFDQDFVAIEREIKFVREEADRLGIEFETLLEQYTRFVNNVPDGTMNIDQIRYSFTGIAEASRAAGLGTQDIQSVFTALGQIASKGALSMEELRQQLGERIPGAIENTAKGLSMMTGELVTTEELLQRINRGEVGSAAIVALAESLRKEFGPALETALDSPLAAMARFKNALYDIRIEIAESGFIDELTSGLQELTKQMRTREFREGMQDFAGALSATVRFAVTLVKNMDTVLAVLKAIVALKLAGYLRNLTGQLAAMGAAARAAALQVRTATGAVARLRAAVIALWNAVLLLPAAFYAGFAIGDQLQQQYPEVRKFGATLVGVFEKSISRVNEAWDVFLVQMKGGWVSIVKEIARAFVTIIPTVFWRTIETVGNGLGLLNESLGKQVKEFALASLGEIDRAADNMLDGIFDTSGADAAIADIRKKAEAERAAIDGIITDMFINIDGQSNQGSQEEEGAKAGFEYGEAFQQSLRELDYFQTGVNAGKSMGEGLIEELKRIERSLQEESADTLEERLRLIETEFSEFLGNLSAFDIEGDEAIVEIQKKAQEEIERIRSNSNMNQEAAARNIADIERRAAQEVAQIREGQQALSGASTTVRQLIELRKEKEREKFIDEQIEKTQDNINEIVQNRASEQERVNELADLGLITAEEQGRRLDEINQRSLATLREAVVEARRLAEETGDADLSTFVAQFDGFEELEKRRAAVQELGRLEQAINEQYDLRQTKLDTINTLRETGAIDAATAEARAREILDQSNQTLGEMVDKALAMARALGDESLVANLENMKAQLQGLNTDLFSGEQLADDFASGFTSAFSSFVQGTQSAMDAFRQFAANFLRQIAEMILQQMIFNAIRGFMGGVAGGLNAVSPTTAVAQHSGGITGMDGTRRTIDPRWFMGAMRYHSGGVAGLKPNEVPAILEKGEEVLTRDDPRHVNNQGSGSQPTSVKIVNALDSSSIVSEGLNNAQGQKAIINFMRANKSQIKSVLQ